MKNFQMATLLALLFLTVSCTTLTGHRTMADREEILNKLPMLNNELLGELKYDDPEVDLKTLELGPYEDLIDRVDLTEDYQVVVRFIRDVDSEKKFVVLRDTFVACLRSEKQQMALCDEAETPFVDRVFTGKRLPSLENVYTDFLAGEK
jgi:hypothetical protein